MATATNSSVPGWLPQGELLGRQVMVWFDANPGEDVPGVVVRHDRAHTLIALVDGRLVEASECHYRVERVGARLYNRARLQTWLEQLSDAWNPLLNRPARA